MKYIVKSTVSNEVLLYFKEDFDYRLVFEKKDDFINLLKMRFPVFDKKSTLRVYGVPEISLKAYKSSKVSKHAFDFAPEEKYRLLNDEIPGSDNQETVVKKQKEQDPNNFEFANRSSIVVGKTEMKKPGGDDKLGDMAFDEDEEDLDIDEALNDNLFEHITNLTPAKPG